MNEVTTIDYAKVDQLANMSRQDLMRLKLHLEGDVLPMLQTTAATLLYSRESKKNAIRPGCLGKVLILMFIIILVASIFLLYWGFSAGAHGIGAVFAGLLFSPVSAFALYQMLVVNVRNRKAAYDGTELILTESMEALKAAQDLHKEIIIQLA